MEMLTGYHGCLIGNEQGGEDPRSLAAVARVAGAFGAQTKQSEHPGTQPRGQATGTHDHAWLSRAVQGEKGGQPGVQEIVER